MIKVFNFAIQEKTKEELRYSLNYTINREKVLRILFQSYSIVKNNDDTKLMRKLSDDLYFKISRDSDIQQFLVKIVIERFLNELHNFRKFWTQCHIPWNHKKNRIFSKMRIYLHKLYRLAPVFDYKRARVNLQIFQQFLMRENFWPHISTQLAIVIYITDQNDDIYWKRLRVQNIRLLANTSAYAFYGTRNKLIEKGVLDKNE